MSENLNCPLCKDREAMGFRTKGGMIEHFLVDHSDIEVAEALGNVFGACQSAPVPKPKRDFSKWTSPDRDFSDERSVRLEEIADRRAVGVFGTHPSLERAFNSENTTRKAEVKRRLTNHLKKKGYNVAPLEKILRKLDAPKPALKKESPSDGVAASKSGHPLVLTTEQVKQMQKLRRDGAQVAPLAKRFHVSRKTVSYWTNSEHREHVKKYQREYQRDLSPMKNVPHGKLIE